jgi:uncharacterized protein (DUF305 family)
MPKMIVKHVRLLLSLVTAVTTGMLGVAGCGLVSGGQGRGDVTATVLAGPSANVVFNDADIAFAQNMIPHHQQAVEMADLAATRAADREVWTIAAQIKAVQAPEIATMTRWLTTWGSHTLPPSVHGGHGNSVMPGMVEQADMDQLTAASGTAFDRLFAKMMIAHHLGAIQMAGDEEQQGAAPEAKALAAAIKAAQKAEVTRLQTMLDRL